MTPGDRVESCAQRFLDLLVGRIRQRELEHLHLTAIREDALRPLGSYERMSVGVLSLARLVKVSREDASVESQVAIGRARDSSVQSGEHVGRDRLVHDLAHAVVNEVEAGHTFASHGLQDSSFCQSIQAYRHALELFSRGGSELLGRKSAADDRRKLQETERALGEACHETP